jgi:subtilisin family serine protease
MAERIIVAVIDSGVHPDHPHIDAARLLPGASVALDGSLSEEAVPLDRLGHGTAVTAAVQEKAPEAAILPIRVFHEALTTSALALSTAIFAAARGQIINLSLGTTNAAHQALFAAAARCGRRAAGGRRRGAGRAWPPALPARIAGRTQRAARGL